MTIIDKLIKLARILNKSNLTNEAYSVYKIAYEESLRDTSKASVSKCIPLESWEGPPGDMRVYTHSTGLPPESFGSLIADGFRVSKSGGGDLGITFLEEDPSDMVANLRERVRSDNVSYNLGSTVVIAVINPKLLEDRGLDDETLADAEESGPNPMGLKGVKSVRAFEEFEEGHHWSRNAWKMPGRFLYATYDGENDTICINPNWDGSTGTEHGQRMVDNLKKYYQLGPDLERGRDTELYHPTVKSDEVDPEVW